MARAVSVETMRKSDAYTIENLVPSKELMYRVGSGIFSEVDDYDFEAKDGSFIHGWYGPVAIAAGKGNNAGDGFVVAKLLHDRGIPVDIILMDEKFSDDGKFYYDICAEAGVPSYVYSEDMDLGKYRTFVDCLLGTGFSGDVREPMASFIRGINSAAEAGAFVVAADINSGLNGDTGEGSLYVRSDLTISIGEFKFGHFRGRASDAMKDKVNIDIGIEIIGEAEEM